MAMSVLCSLAAMLDILASVLHLVALSMPAWIQMGVFVPYAIDSRGSGGETGGDVSLNNSTLDSPPSSISYKGPLVFVKVEMGLWEWCQQFQYLNPTCQTPEFLSGVGLLEVIVIFTLPVSLVMLIYSTCLEMGSRNKRVIIIVGMVFSLVSGLLVLIALIIYAVLTRREITQMMKMIGKHTQLSYMGWAFGAEAVVCVMVLLAALCIAIHLRVQPKTTKHEFQPVA